MVVDNAAVNYTIRDGVAVITLNNPPVNGLGLSTRTGIVEGLARANSDSTVTAIVITGAGKAFSGGADITEFNTPKATQEPTLHTVIKEVEKSAKPVVAAEARAQIRHGNLRALLFAQGYRASEFISGL